MMLFTYFLFRKKNKEWKKREKVFYLSQLRKVLLCRISPFAYFTCLKCFSIQRILLVIPSIFFHASLFCEHWKFRYDLNKNLQLKAVKILAKWLFCHLLNILCKLNKFPWNFFLFILHLLAINLAYVNH